MKKPIQSGLHISVALLIAAVVIAKLYAFENNWFQGHCVGDVAAKEPCANFWIPHFLIPCLLGACVAIIVARPKCAYDFFSGFISWFVGRSRSDANAVQWTKRRTTNCERWLLCGFGSMAGVLMFFERFGWSVLDPQQVDWLATGDRAQAFLGWSLFRGQPWRFPLGDMPDLMWPEGTNVGFTDPVMLIALLFKLASPWLPADLQYFGIWLLFCYFMQGMVAGLLAALLPGSVFAKAASTLFFTVAPVLLFRWGHFTLSAQFLILYSLYLHFNDAESYGKKLRINVVLVLVAASLHPYLTFMVVILFGGLLATGLLREQIDICSASNHMGVTLIGCALIWWCIGYIGWYDLGPSPGYGHFGANLLSFINPLEFSEFIPGMELANPRQRNGFAYLGLGGILIVGLFLHVKFGARSRGQKAVGFFHPLTCVCLFLSVISIGDTLALGPFGFSLNIWSHALNPALESFRASGRFIWPLYYFILFVALRSYLASRRKIPADVALGLIAIVQVADLRPLIRTPEGITATEQIQLSSQSEWESLLRDKQSILFYPPYAQTYASHADYRYFWNLARGKSMRLNFGYVSRFNPVTASKADNSMRVEIERGQKQEGALYISSVENSYIFQHNDGRWQCRTLDGYLICQ